MKRRKQLSLGELQARGVVGLTKAQMAGGDADLGSFPKRHDGRGEIAYCRSGSGWCGSGSRTRSSG